MKMASRSNLVKQTPENVFQSEAFPKDLGECLKMLRKLMDHIDKLNAQLEVPSARNKELRDHLINFFKKDELNGVKGSGLSLAIVRSTHPQVVDLNKFLKFATKKEENWDLLPGQVSSPAWRARFDDKIEVPGVEPFQRVTLRVTRS
ncbi:MAG: hypothetical protein KGL39_24570 [Patescibacteria group bacterium]|nr:hypothetical protein [Patescibacteria group bacterium]